MGSSALTFVRRYASISSGVTSVVWKELYLPAWCFAAPSARDDQTSRRRASSRRDRRVCGSLDASTNPAPPETLRAALLLLLLLLLGRLDGRGDLLLVELQGPLGRAVPNE